MTAPGHHSRAKPVLRGTDLDERERAVRAALLHARTYDRVMDVLLSMGVCLRDIVNGRRPAHIADARHAAWFVLKDEYGWSYPRIADVFGFDNAAVRSGVRRWAMQVCGLVSYDIGPQFAAWRAV